MAFELSPMSRPPLDPGWAIGGCLAFVIAVVLTPVGAWFWLGAEALLLAFVVGLLGIDPVRLARRWLGLCPVLLLLGLMIALSHPARKSWGVLGVALALTARNGLAVSAPLALGLAYPGPELIRGLGRLGCPALILSTLHFMGRYAHILVEERDRMLTARRARTFGRARSPWAQWAMLGNLLGALFLRSMERGDRVHRAMVARGWDGTIRSLADAEDAP
jgi:cobalt/nickel transport system permease protein